MGETPNIGPKGRLLHDKDAQGITSTVSGSKRPLDVTILDGAGTPITTFGGGTQYTEGDTDASLTGTVAIAEGPSDTATPLQVNAAKELKIELSSSLVALGGGTQYTEGDVDTTITGTATMWEDTGNTLRAVSVALPLPTRISDGTLTATVRDTGASDSLNVAIVDASGAHITSFGGGTQYTEADTDTAITGTAIMFESNTGTSALSVVNNTTPLPIADAGGSLTVDNTVLSVVGGGVEATAQRVTIASDSTGVLSVDDNGGSLTVDGTVSANAGTNLNTSLLALEAGGNLAGAATSLAIIDDWDEVDRAKVNIIAGQIGVQGASGVVNALTQRVVLATDVSLPAGTNNIGDVDILSIIPGTGATNLGKAEDSAHTSADTGVFALGVRNTSNTTSTGADRRYAPLSTDLWDAPISGMRRQTTTLTAINTTYNTTSTETNNSATVDCSMFRRGSFCAIVTETGAATDITFTLQFSNDGGTTWFDYRVGPWVKYRFDDATIAAHTSGQLKICEPFECVAPSVRMSVTGTGLLSGTNEFVVANATFELLN